MQSASTTVVSPFDRLFDAIRKSPTLRQIWRRVYGADYAEGAEPLSYCTKSELDWLRDRLSLAPGRSIIDLGCGQGGPGLVVARPTGARVVGIDVSQVAVAMAKSLAISLGMGDRAQHLCADIADLPFADASFDAALSVDALQLVRDKPAALREIARVLRPGARFGFTTGEIIPSAPVPPSVASRLSIDYGPRLNAAGFDVYSLDIATTWKERQLAIYDCIRTLQGPLRLEMGEAAELLVEEATYEPARLEQLHVQRIIAIAERR